MLRIVIVVPERNDDENEATAGKMTAKVGANDCRLTSTNVSVRRVAKGQNSFLGFVVSRQWQCSLGILETRKITKKIPASVRAIVLNCFPLVIMSSSYTFSSSSVNGSFKFQRPAGRKRLAIGIHE